MAAMFVKVPTELCRCPDHTLPPIPSFGMKRNKLNLSTLQKNKMKFMCSFAGKYVSPKLAKQGFKKLASKLLNGCRGLGIQDLDQRNI